MMKTESRAGENLNISCGLSQWGASCGPVAEAACTGPGKRPGRLRLGKRCVHRNNMIMHVEYAVKPEFVALVV